MIIGPHGEELYNLAADPWEHENLAGDPANGKVVAELKSQLLDEHGVTFNRSGEKCRGFEPREWSVLMD